MAEAVTREFDFGKDHVVLMTDADACVESKYQLPERDVDDNEPRGVIQPNGDFNWECPCLGGMATGPCGFEFREAFTCVQLSKEEPKGMECVDAFRSMQECMNKYPGLYDRDLDDEEIENASTEEDDADVNKNDSQAESSERKPGQVDDKTAESDAGSPASPVSKAK